MTMTTFATVGQRTVLYAEMVMLEHVEPQLILGKIGAVKPLPKGKSDTIKFRRPVPFAVSTVPLQEGVTPTSDLMTWEDVSVQLRQYGKVVTVTDWVMEVGEDPVLTTNAELLGENAGATVEQIIFNAVKGGTTVLYANGASRAAVNTPITLNKQRAVTRTLKRNKAKKITKIVKSSVDYGTVSVEGAFVAVAHVDLEHDLRGLTGFKPVADYGPHSSAISDYEIGRVEDVRYLLSADLAAFADAGGAAGSMVSTSAAQADVYPVLYFGQDAFAQVPLKGMGSMSPVIIPAKPCESDPLAQRNKVGYKFSTAALILNESWMARLEVAATAV